MTLSIEQSLSRKLLRAVLLSALVIGVVLSCSQIVFDAYKVNRSLDADAQRILLMFRDPSTQAIYSLDREMALQVLEGMLRHDAIREASIGQEGETSLAEKERPLSSSGTRWITDLLLDPQRTYSIRLEGRPPYSEHYGDLSITLDTATYGREFLRDSIVIMLSGVLRALAMALILYFIYQWLLTRPLAKMVQHLAKIDPSRPADHTIPMIQGHEKNELGQWVNSANKLLASIQQANEMCREAEDSLHRLSLHDFLTGLANRQQFQAQLAGMIERSAQRKRCVAILCVGLDDFKTINERYSYSTGDQLLVRLADRLRSLQGNMGALARLGGDQFALVQADIEHTYEAADLAQRVLGSLDQPFLIGDQQVRLSATIGITLFPDDGDLAEALLQKAEQTMTLAKTRSRHRYQFYIASVDSEMRRRRELENDLKDAACRGEMHLVYQPQLDYRTKQVCGVEALIRWQHPQYGFIPPDQFVPIAEQSGSILQIGQWVLDQACRQLREWRDMGISVRMAVNLSTVQLRHAELPRLVDNMIQAYRLPAGSLELEVTETGLMEDVAAATEHLAALRRAGALIAIDDFGTGYSSLSYLRSLPLDKIKIDRSFVNDLLQDEDSATIVRAIIQLARSLGLQVIAEGVEVQEQEAYIVAQGCNEGQGYLYSKPLPASECLNYLRQHGYSLYAARV